MKNLHILLSRLSSTLRPRSIAAPAHAGPVGSREFRRHQAEMARQRLVLYASGVGH